MDSFQLPQNLRMHSDKKGPQQNDVFEGLAFDDNYKKLYVSVEVPLFEDGPNADTVDNNAYTRLLEYNVSTRINTRQYAYKLDRVAYPENPPGKFKVNGISEILAIGNGQLIVVERSFSTGRLQCTIKVFITDLTRATNIIDNPSLIANTRFIPAEKKLLLNMDDLGIYIDNIEGVTFGPLLPNGNKTLLFIADNNFNAIQKNQLLLFEIRQ